jgi:hypothetical protein
VKVFISHSYQDRTWASLIADRLSQEEHEVWTASWSTKTGDKLLKKFKKGLSSADVIICIISQNSLASKSVFHEFSVSELSKNHQRIISILTDKIQVPIYLSNYLYLDLSNDPENGLEKLIHELQVNSVKAPESISNKVEMGSQKHAYYNQALKWFRALYDVSKHNRREQVSNQSHPLSGMEKRIRGDDQEKNNTTDNPFSLRNLFAGVLVTILGGVPLAWIIQDARFEPKTIGSPSPSQISADTDGVFYSFFNEDLQDSPLSSPVTNEQKDKILDAALGYQWRNNLSHEMPVITQAIVGSFTAPGRRETAYVVRGVKNEGSSVTRQNDSALVIFAGDLVVSKIFWGSGILRISDLNSDGVDELLLGSGYLWMGVFTRSVKLIEMRGGLVRTVENFGRLMIDSCSDPVGEREIRRAVIYHMPLVEGQYPKFHIKYYIAPCPEDKNGRVSPEDYQEVSKSRWDN